MHRRCEDSIVQRRYVGEAFRPYARADLVDPGSQNHVGEAGRDIANGTSEGRGTGRRSILHLRHRNSGDSEMAEDGAADGHSDPVALECRTRGYLVVRSLSSRSAEVLRSSVRPS